ncbi:hypothetical protein BD560DRAFT_386908 [Blakeslea trispora]|nr:hypothetical protein BD560DRAFT_386908 [Blakeslea trispora]
MKVNSKLERHLLEDMFERSLFSDLSLVFVHPSFPIAMRYNVHKAIVSQSPFLHKLLEHTLENNNHTTLNIDMAQALSNCEFILAPSHHIVRRQWQKTEIQSSQKSNKNDRLLSSHIRFVLKWMYCLNKQDLMKGMDDKDTLRILSVAVLFDLHDLTQACVHRYTQEQLSLDSVMRDLDTICQLPRGHPAYLQLRDAALLLLFRFGPENANRLAMLPADYMADVLSADLLFVECEFDRYCLLRAVLMAYMQSIGKITWTASGPVDQDAKRLSGFVRPLRPMLHTNSATTSLSADTVRSRKRRRIPSQELEDSAELFSPKQPRLNRLSFSALVPFQKLLADATSGDIIDKATVLSYLLRTTVNYSNMSFDQLTCVRQDGIVDEGIVFRALWQREALERVLFPTTYHQQTQLQSSRSNSPIPATIRGDDQERSEALNEYFDVDQSEAQEKRRILLLGTPKFRFRSSVYLDPPSVENGWECEEKYVSNEVISDELASAFDDQDEAESDHSVWYSSEDEEQTSSQVIRSGLDELDMNSQKKSKRSKRIVTKTPYKLYKKVFYSKAETILGISYRVQIEAQVMPRHRLYIQDDNLEKLQEELLYSNHHVDEPVIVCRFELQRDMQQISNTLVQVKKEKDQQDTMIRKKQQPIIPVNPPSSQGYHPPVDMDLREKTKIHYWIYCLNRHEGILENEQVDPEDRVLVAVTEQSERENGEPGEMDPGYVGQVLVEADLQKGVRIDTTVALEIFGFHKV